MSESHVVSGLVARRSELAGIIQHYQSEISRIGDDLGHLDATIKMFAPDFDLRSVSPKRYYRRNQFFRMGECPRLILDVLREGAGTLQPRQILEAIAAKKGWDLDDACLEGIEKVVNATISRMRKNGRIVLKA